MPRSSRTASGGQVVSALAFFSDDRSSNTADVKIFASTIEIHRQVQKKLLPKSALKLLQMFHSPGRAETRLRKVFAQKSNTNLCGMLPSK